MTGCLDQALSGLQSLCNHLKSHFSVFWRTLPLSSMAMKEVNGRYIHVDQRDYSHLRYLMICGCGFPNSRRNFEPAVRQFELLFPNNHTILTVPESPMFNAPEAAVVTVPRLELVRRAGRQYAQTGQIDTALLAEIGSPMIPEELYAKIVNGTAECVRPRVLGCVLYGVSDVRTERYGRRHDRKKNQQCQLLRSQIRYSRRFSICSGIACKAAAVYPGSEMAVEMCSA